MKKLLLAIVAAALMVSVPCFGFPDGSDEETKKKDKPIMQQCPRTLMTESCLECHVVPSFALRETHPEATYMYPPPHF